LECWEPPGLLSVQGERIGEALSVAIIGWRESPPYWMWHLALERVMNSGPLDHASLANLMLFSVFCLNRVIGCDKVVPLN
jgi:hypothetical protein